MGDLLEVFDSETGDTWWIVGHHPDDKAIAAVRFFFAANGGEEWFDDVDLAVTRGWYRDAHDPHDDERWDKCESDAEGAEPFTRIDA